MNHTPKLSPIEKLKNESNYLRGTIPDELLQDSDKFSKDASQLLKHHGTYQQDDRDQRAAAKQDGRGKVYIMMVRTRIPGGRLTSSQWLAMTELADTYGNGTLRVTTRQALQMHGVLKSDLHATIARINEIHLTTLGACGDVNRNVMCCPSPCDTPSHLEIRRLADRLAHHFAPRGGSYQQIWLRELGSDQKQLVSGTDPFDVEPIYGQVYLPRKFKIGIATPDDNCIDIYTQDVGLLAITNGDTIQGYNVLVGGGMGVTPSAAKTFPALGKELCFISADKALELVTAIVQVQRDLGNRSDRKIARLKYLVADLGIEAMREKVGEYFGQALIAPRKVQVKEHDDHIGWHAQNDGKWCYGLSVENGRIQDAGDFRLRSALIQICTTLRPNIRLTGHQNILFTGLDASQKDTLLQILTEHGVRLSDEISNARRWSMACVAWPTCGLSITEAERALPGLIDQFEEKLKSLGLSDEKFTLRMTGCPNGCARPYNADIGLVGKARGKYTLFLGGNRLGTQLNFLYKDLVPEDSVLDELVTVMRCFRERRTAGESFGNFCHRMGRDELLAWSAANVVS